MYGNGLELRAQSALSNNGYYNYGFVQYTFVKHRHYIKEPNKKVVNVNVCITLVKQY